MVEIPRYNKRNYHHFVKGLIQHVNDAAGKLIHIDQKFPNKIMDSKIIKGIRDLLVEFALGKHDFSYVRDYLSGYIEIDFEEGPTTRIIRNNQIEKYIDIPFDKIYMISNLQRYLDGKYSPKELSDWAAFIFGSECFVPKGNTEAEINIEGEGPLWDILQKLMTPQIFDGISPEVISGYLDVLR